MQLIRPVAAVVTLFAVVAAITAAVSFVLRLPGIPYNVAELFLGDGHPAFVAVFALALLWVGGGAMLFAEHLSVTRRPWLTMPVGAMVVSLISLGLLSASVTQESISDISGSNNLFWFVTNKDIWGVWWRKVFLALDSPGFVGFFERIVRFTALYTPPVIFLSWFMAAAGYRQRVGGRRLTYLFLISLPWLWLCKKVAFRWSSTDNLNELVARNGAFGLGGAPYLYLLLALFAFNIALLVRATRRAAWWPAGIVFTVAAIPLGWMLLNLGLEPHIEKYGSVFSGAQFLLGPDRKHALGEMDLFIRWSFVQGACTFAVFIGAWIAQGLLPAARRRSPRTNNATEDKIADIQ